MTDFEQSEQSGLILPVPKKTEPDRKFGVMELQYDDEREEMKLILGQLWHCMGLYKAGGIDIAGNFSQVQDARYKLFRYLGESLLGDECPEFEQLT